jgi:hypothetical protein
MENHNIYIQKIKQTINKFKTQWTY